MNVYIHVDNNFPTVVTKFYLLLNYVNVFSTYMYTIVPTCMTVCMSCIDM